MTEALAHLAPWARPQAPGSPSVRARACVRARPCAPPPVGGEVRTAPQAAGCAVGGAVAMARRARPHTNRRPRVLPPQLPPTGHSLLPLLPPASIVTRSVARPRPTRSTQILSPWSRDAMPHLEVQPVRPNDDNLVQRGYLPGRAGAGAKRALQPEAQVSLGKKATTLRRVRAKERETQALQSCLSMRSRQRLTRAAHVPCFQLLSKPPLTLGLGYFVTATAR